MMNGYPNMYGYHMMYGMGSSWMWLYMLIGGLSFFALVMAALWLIVRHQDHTGPVGYGAAVLKRRLAAGEISSEEFTEKLSLLKK